MKQPASGFASSPWRPGDISGMIIFPGRTLSPIPGAGARFFLFLLRTPQIDHKARSTPRAPIGTDVIREYQGQRGGDL